ncbi:MAG: hypothetical protein ACK40H_05185, partial [Sphingomonadaceae bacterium]
MRDIVRERLGELSVAGQTGRPLQAVRDDFRSVLYAHPQAGGYPDADFDALFAGAFAQVLAFGLLLVREATGRDVTAEAWRAMPAQHELLGTTLRVLS